MKLSVGGRRKLKAIHSGLQSGGGVEMQSVKSGGWDLSCLAGRHPGPARDAAKTRDRGISLTEGDKASWIAASRCRMVRCNSSSKYTGQRGGDVTL
jgi:hypothetical protein